MRYQQLERVANVFVGDWTVAITNRRWLDDSIATTPPTHDLMAARMSPAGAPARSLPVLRADPGATDRRPRTVVDQI